MARSVSRFSVKPNTCMRNTAPMSDTGIATTGTSTVRKLPRNRKITTMTMRIVSSSVCTTSSIALLMYLVASNATLACMPDGSSFWIFFTSSFTRPMTSSELAFGSTQTPMNTAFLPEKRTSWS